MGLNDISSDDKLPAYAPIGDGEGMSGAPEGGDDEVRSAVPVPDLTSIDAAAPSTLASVTIEAVPGYGYVFSSKKSDGLHYGALRVAYVAQNYVVFDWSYQSGIGNVELSRSPVMELSVHSP